MMSLLAQRPGRRRRGRSRCRAVSSAMAARIAAISARATWALPACGTSTRCAPASGQRVPATRWRAVSGWLDEPALVDLVGDEAAEVGVHPPRDRQQDAAVGRHGRVLAEQPVEAGEAGGARMRALHHLRQLARVADQHDVAGAAPHRQQVGEPDLPRLVDDQRVEGALELRPAEVEGGAADDVGGRASARSSVRRDPLDRAAGVVGVVAGRRACARPRRSRCVSPVASSGSAARQPRSRLRDRLVAGRGDRDPPPGRDQREDRASGDVGLAGAGRPLDRQHRVLHREHRAHRARDRVGAAEDVGAPARRRAAAPGARAGRRGRDAAAGRTGRRSPPAPPRRGRACRAAPADAATAGRAGRCPCRRRASRSPSARRGRARRGSTER